MKLSIVVPCYNCRSTIVRLMDSIVNNDLPKEDYEVVIVDDNSTDHFEELVKIYEDKANIAYYHTENVNIHCPGNTRQVGLENAKGDWITFIDNDDYFEPNVFLKVFDIIEKNNVKTVLFTSFYRVFSDRKDEFIANEENMLWLHGNFYNRQFLKDIDLNFKQDLESHEDIYFNVMLKIKGYLNNIQVYYAEDLFTYDWFYNEKSLSNWEDGNGLRYLDIHFKDYLYAVTEPFFDMPDLHSDFVQKHLMSNFLICFFYYQAGIYRMGYDYPRDYYPEIVKFRNRLEKECGVTNEMLLTYVYSNIDFYDTTKIRAYRGVGPFIETQSFRDFLIHL